MFGNCNSNSHAAQDFEQRVNHISGTSGITFPSGKFIRLATMFTLGMIYQYIRYRYANQMLTFKVTHKEGSTPTLRMRPDAYVCPHPTYLDDKGNKRYHYAPLDTAIKIKDKIHFAESYRGFLKAKKENIYFRKQMNFRDGEITRLRSGNIDVNDTNITLLAHTQEFQAEMTHYLGEWDKAEAEVSALKVENAKLKKRNAELEWQVGDLMLENIKHRGNAAHIRHPRSKLKVVFRGVLEEMIGKSRGVIYR